MKLLKKKFIDIIAPSSGLVDLSQLTYIKNKFSSLDYTLNIPDDLLSNEHTFHSNLDQYRLTSFIDAVESDSDIIWCLRGGWGSQKLLPGLINYKKNVKEKFFIGFSDVTSLHLFLSQNWSWRTIHGAGAIQITQDNDPNNINLILDIIDMKTDRIVIPIDSQLNDIFPHDISGKLTGGNLTMLQNSIGTSIQMISKDKIIFIEEINEAGYRIDRSLTHLIQAKLFNGAKAVVFGNFGNETEDVTYALNQFALKIGLPVFKTNYFGHNYHNYPLMYNQVAHILIDNDIVTLQYDVN